MQSSIPKQYLPLAGKTVIEHSLHRLLQSPYLAGIVVALHPEDTFFRTLPLASDARISLVDGGTERSDSVRLALQQVATKAAADDWVLVHDAARPCLTQASLHLLIDTLRHGSVGGILAAPVADTLKRVDSQQYIENTQDRRQLWGAQTPQMFPVQQLVSALQIALDRGLNITDDASAMEAAGFSVQVIAGPSDNLKITRPEDLTLAELILRAQNMSDMACE
jgi:2-C-methyl-D-erythritol 4-phosphate cytidylyltransferase